MGEAGLDERSITICWEEYFEPCLLFESCFSLRENKMSLRNLLSLMWQWIQINVKITFTVFFL